METPLSYIPMDRRQAIAQGRTLPEYNQGAALFADISGFTPLTEMLARELGPRRGAEELTIYLNLVYDALITELHRYGGSVIGFSGDAITCWFEEKMVEGKVKSEGQTPPTLRLSTLRATACALAMQQAMAQFAELHVAGGGTVSLAMKAAVAAGPVRRFVVGDPQHMLIDALAGVTLEHLAAAEHQANRGEVILDMAAITALGEAADIAEWRDDDSTGERFALVSRLTTPVAPAPWPELAPDALDEETVRPWLLPPVYQRLRQGQGEFLAELRPAAALFLRFSGIDYDTDPDAGAKLNTFIQRAEHIFMRYDGSLLQLTIGDKGSYLYAAFGAPIAHEDNVDRAASAALELLALPDNLEFLEAVQIGVSHGRMRAGAYGGTARRTYGVLGDAVNLAARLMQAAEPGQILVSDDAFTRTSDTFVWEKLPAIHVKGKSEPVALNRLVRAQKRRAARSLAEQYPLPPVGRQAVLAKLDEQLSALLSGYGSVVRLVGEAGMGKSHLAAHLSREAEAHGVRLAVGVCQSITSNTPYRPWRQIFYSLLNLEDSGEAEAIAAITAYLQREHPDALVRLPLLSDVLALPIADNPTTAAMDSDLRQKSLFSLLVALTQGWARAQPLILILENAHWLDESSLALTQTLLQQVVSSQPVMLLLLHRPPLLGDPLLLPDLVDLPYYTELRLTEMPDEDVAAIMERRLGGPHTPLLLEVVQPMARGNPFFVGELLDTMRQSNQLTQDEAGVWRIADSLLAVLQRANFLTQVDGVWRLKPEADLSTVKLGIPDSVHGLILSRLDRLPEPHKLTLKVSSVLGYTIDLALLAQAHPEEKEVAELEAEADYMETEEVVREDTPYRKIYAFRHHSTQEVAYETLLYTQRRQLHRDVAEALASYQPEAITQIAHHAFLGEAWPLALRYNLLAGERAKQLHANQQSLDFFQKALTSAQALPDQETAEPRKRIHLALGELLISTGQYDAAHDHLRAALALAHSQGDVESQARCYRWYGRSHELRGEYALALSWLDKGFAVVEGRGSSEEAELSLIAGLINIRQGKYDEALALCRRSLQVGLTLDDAAIRARTYNLMGIVDRRRGDSAAAIERFSQSLAQYEQLENVYGRATSHNLIANGYFMRDEWSRADFHYHQSLDLFTQIGDLYNQVLVNNNLGGIALKQGRLDAALGYYQRAVRLLEQTGGSLWVFGALHMNIGHTYIERRELAAAAERLQLAHAYFTQAQVRDLLPELYGLLAECAWLQGELATAESQGQQAVSLARELVMPREEGRARRILGEVARAGGHIDQAEQQLQESYTILHEAGDEYESARTQLSLAQLYAMQGNEARAAPVLEQCEAIFGRLEAQLDLDHARRLRQAINHAVGGANQDDR